MCINTVYNYVKNNTKRQKIIAKKFNGHHFGKYIYSIMLVEHRQAFMQAFKHESLSMFN